MKRLYYITALLCFGCATNVQNMTSEQITSQRIVNHKKSKTSSYTDLNAFLAKSLSNSNYAIKHSDKDEGIIVVKFTSDCPSGTMVDPKIEYDMNIDLKENKTRITLISSGITMFSYISKQNESLPLAYSEEFYKSSKQCRENLLDQFEKVLTTQKDDNW
jgi:hypothetical protein